MSNKVLPLREELPSEPIVMFGPKTEKETAADEFNYSFFRHFINGCNKAADDELRRHYRETGFLPPFADERISL